MEDYEKEEYWKYVEEFISELKTAKYWFQNSIFGDSTGQTKIGDFS